MQWVCITTEETQGFPGGSDGKESACSEGSLGSIPGSGRSPGEGNSNPLQDSCLENPGDRGAWWAAVHRVSQSWTLLKRLSIHACIGEGNGNLFQYSCLENPRDRGAWWAAVYGDAQSWTRLKRLSSSSSSQYSCLENFMDRGAWVGPSPWGRRVRHN